MQYFEYFSQSDLEAIHDATLSVMKNTGLDIDHEPARALFKQAGCKVDGKRVYFPAKVVEEQIKKAPSEFTLYGRDTDNAVRIGGDSIAFMPGYGPPFVYDLDKGRRISSYEDYCNFAKLACASPYMDITGGTMAEPNDVPVARRNAKMMYASMKYSDKPFMGAGTGPVEAQQSLEMASMLFGSLQELAQRPPFISVLCSITPLAYDEKMLAAIMEYARVGMPQLISSLCNAGATSPVSMEGTLVVQCAEILAGITLAQLVREGTPVVFAGSSTCSAMRYGTMSIGAPEMAVNTAATAQMARFYQLPSRGGGALSDAKTVDTQAAFESMQSQLMATLSGIHFVLHSAGILESYMAISYEKFIIDSEICGMCKRIKRGEELSAEKLALDVIASVGPGGEYLTSRHTLQHFRKELYAPLLEEKATFDKWTEQGSLPLEQRANAKWKEMLAEYTQPALPAQVEKDLVQYIEAIQS